MTIPDQSREAFEVIEKLLDKLDAGPMSFGGLTDREYKASRKEAAEIILGWWQAARQAERESSEWKRAVKFCEEHLRKPDEDGCSCELHAILERGREAVLEEAARRCEKMPGTGREIKGAHWVKRDDVVQLLQRTTVAGAAPEIGWLVEDEFGTFCIGLECGNKLSWVTFTNDNAIRFARKRDAENAITVWKLNGIAREHSWG